MTRTLIAALVLCGLAAGVAHAGAKPGIASGSNASTRMATGGGQVTSYGTRIGTAGTGDGNRGAQGQGHAAAAGGHHGR